LGKKQKNKVVVGREGEGEGTKTSKGSSMNHEKKRGEKRPFLCSYLEGKKDHAATPWTREQKERKRESS